jgi:hypothetical protein
MFYFNLKIGFIDMFRVLRLQNENKIVELYLLRVTFQEKISGFIYFDTRHHLVVLRALFVSRHWE